MRNQPYFESVNGKSGFWKCPKYNYNKIYYYGLPSLCLLMVAVILFNVYHHLSREWSAGYSISANGVSGFVEFSGTMVSDHYRSNVNIKIRAGDHSSFLKMKIKKDEATIGMARSIFEKFMSGKIQVVDTIKESNE